MTHLEIWLLIALIFFILTTVLAANRLLKIIDQLEVKRIFEVLPKLKEWQKTIKDDSELLENICQFFQVKPKFIIRELKQLVWDKMDLQTKLDNFIKEKEDIKTIKENHNTELYEQSQIFKKKVLEQKENQKNEIEKLNEKHGKELDEQNTLIKKGSEKLKDVSVKLNKIVEVIIKQNPDEEIEDILKEFDAFYVINASLIKWERVYAMQIETNKSIYDRLRTVCKKYNEPMEIRKHKNSWLKK